MKDIFFINPWLKTIIPLFLMGVASITASSLVVEVAKGSDIIWFDIPKKLSFYIFTISTILLSVFQVNVIKYEKNLLKGFTAKQYEEAIRNKVAEDVAKRSIKLIQEGKIEQLDKETEIFQKLYGEIKK